MFSRTITLLLKVLSAIFCAVPALSRVLPLMTSGPVASTMAISQAAASGAPGLLTKPSVRAPASRAACAAPIA